jgi:hypothetical protein
MQIGEVLFVKSTEEPTMVHSLRARRWYEIWLPKATAGVYTVRRPLVNPHGGVTYKITQFLVEELETESEQSARLFQRFKQRQAMSMSEEGPVGGPLSFKTN